MILSAGLFLANVYSEFYILQTDNSSPARITKMSVSPSVIPMRTGAKITASGEMVNNARPPNGATYTIKVKVERKAWFWVTLPCIKFLGSW